MKSYLNATRKEILDRAAQLEDETLQSFHLEASRATVDRLRINTKDKGKLGNLVEVLHFGLTLNNESRPDFIAAHIELKTTGLEQQTKGSLVAKERLPLGMIDYMSFQVPDQCVFESSAVLKKCGTLLLMFYVYEKGVDIVDLMFKVTGVWEFPRIDLEIIRRDWEFLVNKIRDGRANELSEGDTLYLGASTAGAGHGKQRDAPGPVRAKPRKFSLKKSYLNHICAELSGRKFGRILDSPSHIISNRTLESIVVGKFERFYNKSFDEISSLLGLRLNQSSKDVAAQLTRAVLKIELNKEIAEFDKAGIISKTVRLEPTDLPEQSISFPAFRYEELVNERWEDSEFRDVLESKFFFVFFQYDRPKKVKGKKVKDRKLILQRVQFWNMPSNDISTAKEVWLRAIDLIKEGRIVKGFKSNGDRITYFPGVNDNPVSHVRPHGTNREDTFPLPVADIYTGWSHYTKHCFWINNRYVRDVIYRK